MELGKGREAFNGCLRSSFALSGFARSAFPAQLQRFIAPIGTVDGRLTLGRLSPWFEIKVSL
jgi:hypothetical protein